MPSIVYLDHAATTPLRPEALEKMSPWLTNGYGNPSGMHSVARAARRALDDARDVMAEALGGEPGEIVFTSGGTEADNLAVTGAALAAGGVVGDTIACSAVEHPAVLESVRALSGRVLGVDLTGTVDLETLAAWVGSAGPGIVEVSVMLVNNETGLIQPLSTLASLVRAGAPDALIHTDAVQAVGYLDVAADAAAADLVTVSGHKFGGPKGVGALLVRAAARSRLRPVLLGGPQERELRAGTPDVAGIVGMAEAARLALVERAAHVEQMERLGRILEAGLVAPEGGGGRLAVPPDKRLSSICNVSFEGVEAEELLLLLDQFGICASAGSSCASGAIEPSHVLLAMGRTAAEARTHVRLSLGARTSDADVLSAVTAVGRAVTQLRAGA